jgi:hypothetical protein
MMDKPEHYVTLFDSTFLPFGLCLHESLSRIRHAFQLWIVCMDDAVFDQLTLLKLSNVTLLRLADVETDALRAVKSGRTKGEYCWTMTPFSPQFVFDHAPSIDRVTYVDADLYFFEEPTAILEEFSASQKHVLITEHAYDPAYDYSDSSGRFCVQFMTFRNTPQSLSVMREWQAQCLEWCFDRVEPGRFGDQKYLDAWPQRHGDAIHILAQVERTIAPWNARFFHARDGSLSATFFHFHGFRLLGRHRALLFSHFQVGRAARRYYDQYLQSMRRALKRVQAIGVTVPQRPIPPALKGWRNTLREWAHGRAAFAKV